MPKRKLSLLILVLAIIAVAIFAYVKAPQSNSLAENPERVGPHSDSKGRRIEVLTPAAQTVLRENARVVPQTMRPERAYADAAAIMKCTHAAGDIALPDDMTTEQKKEFERSRVEGLDCAALDSPYSAYELARYAAERGNLEAQLHFPALAASTFNEEVNALNPQLVADFKADSMKFLNMAASSGSPEAYASLAENYRSGLFSGKDKIRAYAHAFASSQLRPSPISKRWANEFGNGLSASEEARARQMGLELVRRSRK